MKNELQGRLLLLWHGVGITVTREYVQVYAAWWFLWRLMEHASVNSQLLALWSEEHLSPPLSLYDLRIGCRHEHQSMCVDRWAASVPENKTLACLDTIHIINANMKGLHSVKRHRIAIVSFYLDFLLLWSNQGQMSKGFYSVPGWSCRCVLVALVFIISA